MNSAGMVSKVRSQGHLDLDLGLDLGSVRVLGGSGLWVPPRYIIIRPMWINGSVSKVASEAA
jgi:hypothetical protein